MKILFAASELKNRGGKELKFEIDRLFLNEISSLRKTLIAEYFEALKIEKYKKEMLKNYDEKEIDFKKLLPAIERYEGVAYKALDFATLTKTQKEFLLEKTVIFSNLFGVLLAKDEIPYYHLRQGATIGDADQYKLYQKELKEPLDRAFKDSLIVDLRPIFYDKIYLLKYPHITFKFYKNGKIQSHYAKFYRGELLRQIAIERPLTKEAVINLKPKGLRLIEIMQLGIKTQLNYEII